MFYNKKFFKYINDNKIYNTILSTVIGTYVTNLVICFCNDIITPVLNRDINNDGIKDIYKYENYIIRIFNINFRLGHFITEFFNFIIIMYIIFYINKIFIKKKIIN